MLAKRIIPCLDVKDGNVVKGVKFRDHKTIGDIIELASYYSMSGADELVFYDITASSENRSVDTHWIKSIAKKINIPFCVAGGIRTLQDTERVLNAGADKISINSPALEDPNLINQMVAAFGQQCIVIGIDSHRVGDTFKVCQYTGNEATSKITERDTLAWVKEIQDRGAGEIVFNCMDSDGVRNGYDLSQLNAVRAISTIPVIASGGAGALSHFVDVFREANVDAALAASVFHTKQIQIAQLKRYLTERNITVRPTKLARKK